MDLLVTVIGNAVLDPTFRECLLDHPREAIDEWGLHLTKGESKMLDAMFTKEKKKALAPLFDRLQDKLIEGKATMSALMCNQKLCPGPGCYPPPSRQELRNELDRIERERLNGLKRLHGLKRTA